MAELSRRDFVSRAGVATAAIALGRPGLAEAAPDLRRWSAVRAQFALDPKRIHLASFLLAAHPRAVREAIERHRRGLDRDSVTYLHANEGRLTSDARTAAGRYLGVAADEVALTDSTTMGLGLLYTRLELKPGEEVLTTEHDFYATHEALRLSGARVRRVRLYDDPRRASVDEIVTRLRRAVSERTRVVALTWVHSSTGVKLPIRAIADALPDRILLSSTACTASATKRHRCVSCAATHSSPAVTSGSTGPAVPASCGRTAACASSCDRRSPRSTTGRATAPGCRAASPAGYRRRRAADAGRLSLFRAPVGAHGGVPLPRCHRAGARQSEGARTRTEAPDAAFGDQERPPANAVFGRRLRRARLLRGRGCRSRGRRATPGGPRNRCERHAVRAALRASGAGNRQHSRGDRRGGASHQGALTSPRTWTREQA